MMWVSSRASRPTAFVIGMATVIAASSAFAQNSADLQKRWQEFQKNPRAFMQQLPPKYDAKGHQLTSQAKPAFSAKDIQSREFITKKTSRAQNICNDKGICLNDVIEGRAAAQASVDSFLDAHEFQTKGLTPALTLQEMEARGLRSAQVETTPWSDTYWPLFQGVIASRYASESFAYAGDNWKSFYDIISSKDHSLKTIYRGGDAEAIDELSPAEKYDLLIGDISGQYEAGYLTPHLWREGEKFWSTAGEVESWMGICHGWAPASFMIPRPIKPVTVTAANDKTPLKFYPSDLKALASYSWSNTSAPMNFLGGRCNEKDPKTDPKSGRLMDDDCFDTNPANWHQAIVNQIGVAGRSFVMDVTYDYEVWNQPVQSYSYRYFNPATGAEAKSLNAGGVIVTDFKNDQFKQFRSSEAKYIVGIEMTVTYMVETSPSHAEVDSEAYDQTATVTYMYDIELDKNFQMIGGEWYSNSHPDFIWAPTMSARAESYGDQQLNAGDWKPGQPLPKFWRDIAKTVATRYGQVLANIVEPLVAETRKSEQ